MLFVFHRNMTSTSSSSSSPIAAPVPPPDALPATILVLCYRSERFITRCLDALADLRRRPGEIIVVENASGDAAAARAREHPLRPRVIETQANLGFGGGNNLGWREARGEFVIFLNPDCVIEPDCAEALIRPLIERPGEIGVTGAKLYYPNSHILQHAGGIIHENAMSEHRGMGQLDTGRFDAPAEVPYVTGAAMAMRRETLLRTGGFDEDFFPAYYEEADLCLRVRRRLGLKTLYVPEAVGYHMESATVKRGSDRFVRLAYRSRIVYLIKNASARQWLTEVIPFELDWLRQPYSKGFRWAAMRSYAQGAGFAARCLMRLSRRPAAIRRATRAPLASTALFAPPVHKKEN